ncbi:MAG: GntR family transcriptional regulator [Ignavibacteriales bacterium]|nr:MAG: GntR family transcriptional regulator [Ignavibacteriales bacterium]
MVLKINHKSSEPLHVQVEKLLRGLINNPEYNGNGKFLPKEVDLAKRLGISRNTVRHATNKLVYEGLLVRKKGIGTKVADNPVSTKLDSWHSFTQEMNQKGIPFINYDIKVEWVDVESFVADFFSVPLGKKILMMERLRGIGKGPIVYFVSYFHPRVGLTGQEDFSKPLYKMLEEEHSTVVSISKEEISAKIADDFLAKKLSIKKGAPVLKRKRFVFDPGGRPVEYNVGYYNAEAFTYSIEIQSKD